MGSRGVKLRYTWQEQSWGRRGLAERIIPCQSRLLCWALIENKCTPEKARMVPRHKGLRDHFAAISIFIPALKAQAEAGSSVRSWEGSGQEWTGLDLALLHSGHTSPIQNWSPKAPSRVGTGTVCPQGRLLGRNRDKATVSTWTQKEIHHLIIHLHPPGLLPRGTWLIVWQVDFTFNSPKGL